MKIPFKQGLTSQQKDTIAKLVEGKHIGLWSSQDKANWAYATNNAPLPKVASSVISAHLRTLFVDLGHSSRFPGASGVKREIAWNRDIWSYLKSKLDLSKWNVVLVPESYGLFDLTSNGNLINRIKYINSRCKDGDWVLSIHGNAASNPNVRGVTTCYMGGSEYMLKKAVSLSQAYSKATGTPLWGSGAFDDRMSRYKRLGMVRDTRPPALLIECGFVTNKDDMSVGPMNIAEAIAKWFNTL